MGHGIEELDGAAYALQAAWHGLGTVLDHHMTAEEALQTAGLDWTVIKEPAVDQAGQQIPGFWWTVRDDLPASDVRRYLGNVGALYEPMQNRDAFTFADAVIGESGAHYESAFSIGNGKRVALLVKLPEVMRVLDDVVEPFLLVTNDHTGKRRFETLLTSVRVVCQNTLTLALGSAKSRFAVRHTVNAKDAVAQAQYALGLAKEHFAEQEATLEALARSNVKDAFAEQYVSELFPAKAAPAPARTRNTRELVLGLYHGGQAGAEQQAVKGTGYGLLQATFEYADHRRVSFGMSGRDKAEARADSILWGNTAGFKQRAFDLLCDRLEVGTN